MFNISNHKEQMKLNLQKYSILNENLRTFVFQRQDTQQSILLDLSITTEQQYVDLYDIFEQYCPLRSHKVSIYDPESNQFICLCKINAELNGKVPRQLLSTRVIMVRFKKNSESTYISQSDSGAEFNQSELKQKKDRSKQRTIGQTIQIVKQWRSLHLSSLKAGIAKLSLKQAARAVGVSKKSLDDYYYQLRLGQFYNFDFNNNLNEKVGILRAFVKEFKPERELKNKNMRHPKNLKIIDNWPTLQDQKSQRRTANQQIIQEVKSIASVQNIQDDEESLQSFSNPFSHELVNSYEDRFFKNFEFLMDDPNDPFLEVDKDFKKKQFEEQNNEYFMF